MHDGCVLYLGWIYTTMPNPKFIASIHFWLFAYNYFCKWPITDICIYTSLILKQPACVDAIWLPTQKAKSNINEKLIIE